MSPLRLASSLSLALLLLSAAPLAPADTGRLADGLVQRIRPLQSADGSYGSGFADTCRVLDALARSPRRYTDLDGPFMRRAVEWILDIAPTPETDALRALGLSCAITVRATAEREAALDRLAAASHTPDLDALLAWRALRPNASLPPNWEAEASARAAAEEPHPDAASAWARWVRFARLDGRTPTERAQPVPPADSATVAELVDALEVVIALHGLPALPAVDTARVDAGTAKPALPPHAAPGRDPSVALEAAWHFLHERQRGGTFGLELPGWEGPEPGVTAMCLSATAILADRLGQPRPEWFADGLDYLVGLQQEDGAIMQIGLDVYTTSVALDALLAGGRPEDAPVIERARRFLLAAQADEGEGYLSEDDPHYGGIGYGNDERPDLSNTHMAIEAAARAGTPSTDPFYAKALVFLERCHNTGEAGALSWPRLAGGRLVNGIDGGATYMPGNSMAGEIEIAPGIWQARSYGSMTYALLKSYIFCGLPRDDARVRAAVTWLSRNFTVETNPGYANATEGAQGLYYYYLTLARTLARLASHEFTDEAGTPIAWREQLTRKLVDAQRADGSWINDASPRWWEGAPPLATAYAVLALAAAGA